MKLFGKIIGLVCLGLLIVLVALGFAITQLFDPNDYKDDIQKLALEKANLDLRINGEIGWSLFPWLGLELHDTQIANPDDPEQPLAHLGKLGLSVRVLPLLRKEIQMSDIHLDNLTLNLIRNRQGQGNWEGIGQKTADKPSNPADQSASTPEPGAASEAEKMPLLLDIDSLNIGNAQINYRDEQSASAFKIEGIYLETGAIREGRDIPVSLSAFYGSNQPLLRARIELKGLAHYDLSEQRFEFKDLLLGGEASGEPLASKTLSFSATGQLLLDQKAQQFSWSGISLSANQLRALGELRVSELDQQGKLQGQLSIAKLNLRDFLEGIGQTLPNMADRNSLSQFELASQLSGSKNSIALEQLELTLDDSQIKGRLALTDLSKSAVLIQLSANQINLDRYLAPADKADTQQRQAEVDNVLKQSTSSGTSALPTAPSNSPWSSKALLPLSSLKALNLQADLQIGELQARQYQLSNLSLKARSRSGLIQLEQLRGGLLQGQIDLSGQVDARQDLPELSLNAQVKGMQIAPLLSQDGKAAPLNGRLDLNSELRTRGNSEKAWIDNLNGNAAFTLRDGVLYDANLEQQLCMAIATLNRKHLSNEPRGRDTPFETLSGSLQIRNGIASNSDLKAQIPGLSVNGKGQLDLRVLGMDYHVGLIIQGDTREMPDAACTVNQRYAGLEWPIRCRGPIELGAKACRLDQDGLGRVAARLAGEKLNEKIEEKLGDKVSPELRDALKNLFNR